MLDQAFAALKSYDWGADRNTLNPIDEAIVTTHGDPSARQELESHLVELLQAEISRDAKDYICRKLMVIGTAAAVPALAELLGQAEDSHMARYALERISAPEAGQALRDALAKVHDALKIGVMGSLGVRGDTACIPQLSALLRSTNSSVASAAAYALGALHTSESAKGLSQAAAASEPVRRAAIDAALACAEKLLADGKRAEALQLYKQFNGEQQPKHVRLAATRGILACAGKKE